MENDEFASALNHVKITLMKALQVQSNLCLRDSQSITRMQLIFDMKYQNQYQQLIHEFVMNYAVKSEKVGPGSFFLTIEKILANINIKDCDDIENQIRNKISLGSSVPIKNDYIWCIDTFMNASITDKNILRQALIYAGFAGRIILEKSKTSDSIEVMKGYTFEGLKPQWDMNLHLKNCRILCIDGYIESASEIHNFLSSSSESNEYVVMFIRGLSQDVLNTIKVNFDRGTIRVLPVIVPFDILGINMINDISIVSGCDLKTSLKGDQITTLSLVDSSIIEEIIITSSKVTIINRKTNYSVSTHTKVLLEKREKEKIDDAIELIDKRLRALSPNHVVIRLLNDHNWTSRVQSFDYTLRAIKSLNEHGTLCIDNKKQLTSTFIASELCSIRCIKELKKVGYLLI
jgi:hypothetical protein